MVYERRVGKDATAKSNSPGLAEHWEQAVLGRNCW